MSRDAARQAQYLQALGVYRWVSRRPGPAAASVPAAASAATADASAWDQVAAEVSGCVLCGLHKTRTQTVFGVGNRNARVQTWQCFGSANQEWGIIFAGTYGGVDYFEFAGKTTGSLCMEVRDSSFSDGAQVDQFPCAPDANQLWKLGPGTGNNSFTLVSMNSGKCLDVSGNSTANGAKVQQWDCNGTTAQSFTFN